MGLFRHLGEESGLPGRLVAIADAFDVMTATRSYKKPLPAEQARAELLRNAGTQFDPGLVRSFLQISLGRMRWTIGPMGWFSHLPNLFRSPLSSAASSGSGVAAAAGAAALAVSSVAVVPAATTEIEAGGAERAVPVEVVVKVADVPSAPGTPVCPGPVDVAEPETAPSTTTAPHHRDGPHCRGGGGRRVHDHPRQSIDHVECPWQRRFWGVLG